MSMGLQLVPVSLVHFLTHVFHTHICGIISSGGGKTFRMARVEMMVQALLPFRPSMWTALSEQATGFHICPKGTR